MRRRHLATAILAAGLLAGCTPTPTPAGTLTATPTTTSPTTASPAPTTATTPPPTGDETQITAQIKGYAAWLDKAFSDPTVKPSDAALYVTDVEPDYVLTAVQRGILKFRADQYTQTGATVVAVEKVTPGANGTYTARSCSDLSGVVVKNAKGEAVDTGPKRQAAQYTLVKRPKDWAIAKIQGVGTC